MLGLKILLIFNSGSKKRRFGNTPAFRFKPNPTWHPRPQDLEALHPVCFSSFFFSSWVFTSCPCSTVSLSTCHVSGAWRSGPHCGPLPLLHPCPMSHSAPRSVCYPRIQSLEAISVTRRPGEAPVSWTRRACFPWSTSWLHKLECPDPGLIPFFQNCKHPKDEDGPLPFRVGGVRE